MRSLLMINSGLARRTAALALVLWLGGAGCLLGCEVIWAATVHAGERTESEQTNDSSEHACCQLKNGFDESSAEADAQSATGAMSCCALAGQTADPARKSHVGDDLSQALTTDVVLSSPVVERCVVALTRRERALGRDRTYLLCCMFLI